ncbi:MAG: pyridoxal phosphate-dependent aminotransferase [Polyangiaceae bacterium]|nr:pyridoxal phosphate-dependent aminotransferase [Polyangiaceae bacterium]
MNTPWQGRTADWEFPPIAAVSSLAAQLRAQGRDLIDLGQAILGLPPPPEAITEVKRYLSEQGPHAYSPDPGLPALRTAIAKMLRDRKQFRNAAMENNMVTCGASQAFANGLVSITCPGDEILTFDPGYFDHSYTIKMAGCIETPIPLKIHENRYSFDIDAMCRAISSRTRAIVLVSPGNPTGAVAPREFVEKLCDICHSKGIWIISDETYDFFTYAPVNHCSPAAIADNNNLAVVGSFSKTLGMAGWRVGYLYGPEELIEQAYKIQDALVVCAPVPSQRGVLAALSHLDTYVSNAREELCKRRSALLSAIESWGLVKPRIPDGATFFLGKINSSISDIEFCKHLLTKAGIVAVPGSAFGAQGKGSIRLSFGNQPCDKIAEAGERLRKFFPS